MTEAPRLLVFDSGFGGLSVVAEIRKALPAARLTYLADTAVFPYGDLAEADLVARVAALMAEAMPRFAPDAVVIACNTASTLVLPDLRARFTLPIVGTVPAVKPAAETSVSRMVSVLATPGTVKRDYTRGLVAAHGQDCRFTLVGSKRLAPLVEAEFAGQAVADADLLAEIAPCFVEEGADRTDTVVLACTHYPLVLARLRNLAPWPVTWIDPAPAIARQVARVTSTVAREPAGEGAEAGRGGGEGADVFYATGRLPPEGLTERYGFLRQLAFA
ncbi:glutamate racemase [Methylobrevis pamukkalensis]|uniref:Glutamate racemase n=1 Tax=Methylobrevis pamukkalensis TaxID=1439726 RepID=A0A1E3H244_9HYPH|nr:glutamate racemase [Methylobrevis pamukkalensis]ODN70382.1 Glutamate racemase [Methylobrevis pamukkalensis]